MKRFRITSNHYEQVRKHLFPGDGNEAVAVALCGVSRHSDYQTISVMDVLLVPYEVCSVRTPVRISWPTEVINSFLLRATAERLAIVKIHCHPGGGEEFSGYDDISDNELFEHIFAWTQHSGMHGSCVMLPDGRLFGRFYETDLKSVPIDRIAVVGADLIEWYYDEGQDFDQRLQKRNLQAFGKGTIEQLGRMKIGVVGLSGTGSPVAEQLKRYGVGYIVGVDPDHIDFHNLNRIIGSTLDDAQHGRLKTEVLSREIGKTGFKTTLTVFSKDIVDVEVVKELSTCDLLFSCVDGVEGRHVLNLISSYYLIPLIDVGVKLDATNDGEIEGIYGSVHFIKPGGSSLLSRGQYTIDQLRATSERRANKEAAARNQYLAAVQEDTPAVITINMHMAAVAVHEMLARIHRYRYTDNESTDVVRVHFHLNKTFVEAYPEPCLFFAKNIGRGDTDNLIDYTELHNHEI